MLETKKSSNKALGHIRPMTKQEFVAQTAQAKKQEVRFTVVWFVVFFSGLIAYTVIIRQTPQPHTLIHIAPLFIFMFACLGAQIWASRRRVARFNLRCPHCKATLTMTSAQVAIATGSCGHCGQKLFSE